MIKEFNEICDFRKKNPGIRGSGLSVHNENLNDVKKALLSLRNELEKKYENYKGINYTFDHSKGQGYFPSILHVSILPPKQKVSKGIYVVICFDILGRGALVGCIESKTNPQGLNTLKRTNKELKIDVDGLRETTKYNDVFENPKEFFYRLEDETELDNHIKKSLNLALYNLKLIDEHELSLKDLVHAKYVEQFNPENIFDAKEKTSTNIAKRRGQKSFRDELLDNYKGKCAITGSSAEEVLEAAHIVPYNGEETNHIQNGILLRADLHLLFDLGLICIQPETYKIIVKKRLRNTEYYQYHDKQIHLPSKKENWPSVKALRYHIIENINADD